MKTQIFAHKGYVGIKAGDKFLNDPTKPGQLGILVSINEVEISQEAFDVLLTVRKSRDAIGDVMCFSTSHGATFGWLGSRTAVVHPQNSEGDRDWTPQLLQSQITSVFPDAEFCAVIDSIPTNDS